MKSVYIGLMIALSGITVMAFSMNLWKVSATLEAHLPWYRRPRFLIGLLGATILNTILDGIAFSLTPLSLIAPMQGLSIAMTVSIAALGIVGPKESVSTMPSVRTAGTPTTLHELHNAEPYSQPCARPLPPNPDPNPNPKP